MSLIDKSIWAPEASHLVCIQMAISGIARVGRLGGGGQSGVWVGRLGGGQR